MLIYRCEKLWNGPHSSFFTKISETASRIQAISEGVAKGHTPLPIRAQCNAWVITVNARKIRCKKEWALWVRIENSEYHQFWNGYFPCILRYHRNVNGIRCYLHEWSVYSKWETWAIETWLENCEALRKVCGLLLVTICARS